MARFLLTHKAREDLKSIAWNAQKTRGVAQSSKYLTQLDNRFGSLAETPTTGRACDGHSSRLPQVP